MSYLLPAHLVWDIFLNANTFSVEFLTPCYTLPSAGSQQDGYFMLQAKVSM